MNEVLSCCDCTHVEVISRDNPIKLADLYLCPKLIDADCVLGAKIWVFGTHRKKLALKSSQLVIKRTHSVKIASLYL